MVCVGAFFSLEPRLPQAAEVFHLALTVSPNFTKRLMASERNVSFPLAQISISAISDSGNRAPYILSRPVAGRWTSSGLADIGLFIILVKHESEPKESWKQSYGSNQLT